MFCSKQDVLCVTANPRCRPALTPCLFSLQVILTSSRWKNPLISSAEWPVRASQRREMNGIDREQQEWAAGSGVSTGFDSLRHQLIDWAAPRPRPLVLRLVWADRAAGGLHTQWTCLIKWLVGWWEGGCDTYSSRWGNQLWMGMWRLQSV